MYILKYIIWRRYPFCPITLARRYLQIFWDYGLTLSRGFPRDAKDDEDPLADLGETEDLTEPTEPN
jgi:hypothetical protein